MKENLLLTRILKNKIYKLMTSISRNVYIDNLDNIVDKYNNTYHTAIKMKPVDVKSNTYIDSNKEINDKDLKFKIGDIARISKYFCERLHYKLVRIFLIKKLKILCRGHMLLMIWTEKKLLERFTKKKYKKHIKKDFRIKKVIKRKGDKL